MDFHLLRTKKIARETRSHTFWHYQVCGTPVHHLPLHYSFLTSPSMISQKPAQYWSVNVGDSERNYPVPDINDNDANVSPLSTIFS